MKRIIYAALACLTFASCEDFLDKQPIEQIGTDEYFKDEASLEKYTNGFLNSYTPSSGDVTRGDGNCDIIEVKQTSSYLYQPVWNSSLQGGWSNSTWNFVYYINTFLERMHEAQGVSEAAFAHYEGTARFWRAWNYFELVKTFGGVPWYDHVVRSDSEEDLYKPRDSREYVMERVLEDLNFACEHCYTSSDWINCARINRYIALAYKARVCLFEGTYRKYHSVDPSTGKAWEDKQASAKFLRECAEACEELMAAGVYSIVNNPAKVKTQYRELFTQEAVNTTEVIWARQMSVGMTTFHDLTWRYTSGSYGQRWSLDQDFVKTYLNLDGSRHTATGEEFTTEVENRDYRLSQSIITPGYTKLVGGISTATPPDFTVTLTGYQVIKFNIDDKAYESASVSYNSLPIMRYAEVLLNYAEAKAELGEFSDDIWNKTIKPLRERAGVDGKRPTSADPYLQQYYGLSDSDLLEIRRERAIELLLEGFRYDDLMRWHLGGLLNKQWYGIYIGEVDKAYDLNNDGVNDVCVTDKAGSEPGVKYIVRNSERTLEEGNSGRLVYNLQRYFDEQRYVHPIPKTALDKNPDLGQNAAWK